MATLPSDLQQCEGCWRWWQKADFRKGGQLLSRCPHCGEDKTKRTMYWKSLKGPSYEYPGFVPLQTTLAPSTSSLATESRSASKRPTPDGASTAPAPNKRARIQQPTPVTPPEDIPPANAITTERRDSLTNQVESPTSTKTYDEKLLPELLRRHDWIREALKKCGNPDKHSTNELVQIHKQQKLKGISISNIEKQLPIQQREFDDLDDKYRRKEDSFQRIEEALADGGYEKEEIEAVRGLAQKPVQKLWEQWNTAGEKLKEKQALIGDLERNVSRLGDEEATILRERRIMKKWWDAMVELELSR